MKRLVVIALVLFAGLCSYGQSDKAPAPKVQVSYEQSISKADMAFAGKDYLVAKRFYKLAATAKPTELYPQTQIDACDKKMSSDSWISTELNCPCNKGKASILPKSNFVYTITSNDSLAHAVLPGTVLKVESHADTLPGNTSVEIKHGKYTVFYSRLAHANVIEGEVIKEGDVIGEILKHETGYMLYFSLTHGKEKEDAMKDVHCK